MGLDPALPFALWLLPAPAWAGRLEDSIGKLAQRHSAHPFVPHLTICSSIGPAGGADRLTAVGSLAGGWGPLWLKLDGLAWGSDYFTFLFLRLHHPHGVDLIAEAKGVLPGCHGPEVGLHLSLLYADPTPGAPGSGMDRGALVHVLDSQLVLQGGDGWISFDRLALVQPGPGGWRHGWPWTIDSTFPLVGEPFGNRP